jgi:aminoglycoside phosphotransferase (APT) family kinase protein
VQAELERFIGGQVGADGVRVEDLRRVSSVGNAREPWAFTARWSHEGVITERSCVMLVQAAAGQLETSLRTEFDTISRLGGRGLAVPDALWIDESGQVLGAPFFVTERVAGTADTRILRRPEGDPAIAAVARQLATEAARLHAVDPAPFGHLTPVAATDAAPAQLAYWDELFRRQRLEAHPALAYAVRWLRERCPVARRVSVVHGDLRFGNLLYDGDRLTALLDWEMTHLGDPVEDLGWVYRDLWTPVRSLPFDEFLAAYEEAGGGPVDREHLRWYQVFAEFKHSVISLTGTRSFADRATLVLRHADRAATVAPFVRRALELMAEGVGPPC